MGTERYWTYEEGFLRGPYLVQELVNLAHFSEQLLVCRDGDHQWRPVRDLHEYQDYRSMPVITSGDFAIEPAVQKQPLQEI